MADIVKNSLLFRQGKLENLNKIAATNDTLGTVYITTDEGGMYIDTLVNDAPSRVRIQGSVLYFDDLENFVETMKPPFSEDVLYFIAKSTSVVNGQPTTKEWNALMRWDPVNEKFIQLNVTMADFLDLSQRYATTEEVVGDHASRLNALEALLNGDADSGEDTGLTAEIAAIKERLSNADGTGVEDRLDDIENRLSNSDSTGIEDRLVDLTGRFETIEGDYPDLKQLVVGDTAYGSVTLPYDKANIVEALGALEEELEKESGVKDRLTSAEEIIEELKELTGLSGDDSGSSGDNSGTSLTGRVAELEGKVSTLEETYFSQSEAESMQEAISSEIDEDVAAAEARVKVVTDALAGRLDDAEATLDDHEGRIGTIESILPNKADRTEVEALGEKLNKEISAANAMRFVDEPIDGVSAYLALFDKTDIQVGDTFVVTANFTYDSVPFHAGDLLVATGDETLTEVTLDDGSTIKRGYITSNLDFIQVDTGYDGIHNNSLEVTETASGDVYLELKDIVGATINSVPVKSTNDNVVVTVTDDNGVGIGLVWDTF